MNRTCIMGKVTKGRGGDTPVRMTRGKNDKLCAFFSVSVYDSFRKQADFFSCAAFGTKADICERYLNAGMLIGLTGMMKMDQKEDDISKRKYTTHTLVVDTISLPPKDGNVMGDGARHNPAGPGEPPEAVGGM